MADNIPNIDNGMLLSFSHYFAKQKKTTQFDTGSKTAITQSILDRLAWYFLSLYANVLLRCWSHQNYPII